MVAGQRGRFPSWKVEIRWGVCIPSPGHFRSKVRRAIHLSIHRNDLPLFPLDASTLSSLSRASCPVDWQLKPELTEIFIGTRRTRRDWTSICQPLWLYKYGLPSSFCALYRFITEKEVFSTFYDYQWKLF